MLQTSEKLARQPKLTVVFTLPGMAYGLANPSVGINLRIPKFGPLDWQPIEKAFLDRFAVRSNIDNAPEAGLFHRAAGLSMNVLRTAGLASTGDVQLLGQRDAVEDILFSLALPCVTGQHRMSLAALAWAVESLWLLAHADDPERASTACLARLQPLQAAMATARPSGTNQLRLIFAAAELGIPCRQVSYRYWQLGWGKRQARFNSSMFHTTSSIAMSVARDKVACASVLRQFGVPVPAHALAGSLEDAKHLAAKLGYPVVVKPSNKDGGVGVSAGLQHEGQLVDAWHEAIKHSSLILVEKHQAGEDYRLIVLDGKLIWAVGREPAGVTGDGHRSVRELVDCANRDPRRGYHPDASLRPIKLDDEAAGLLIEQNCTLDSIPEAGRFIRLRRAANLSSGGTPKVVTDQVHPDNKALVERAVTAIGLDLGGVDMIIPDIAVSWRDSGAAIIEINGQPQLIAASQNHLYSAILSARVERQGRIPIALIVGPQASGLARQVAGHLHAIGLHGVAHGDRHHVHIDGEELGFSYGTAHDAGQGLLMHQEVSMLILAVEDDSLLPTGLPFDRFDLLIVAGSAGIDDEHWPWLATTLQMVAPNCHGSICTGSPAISSWLRQMPNGSLATIDESRDPLALCQRLVDAVTSHIVGNTPESMPT